MANKEKIKNTVLIIASLGGLILFAVWYLGLLDFKDTAKSSVTIPDGYSHTKSKTTDSETVHTFTKSPPTQGYISQSADQAYSRYMESLPDTLDKAIAQEFRTLNVSLQNARLYADTTGLIRQGRENMNELNQLKDKQNEQDQELAMTSNNVNFLVDDRYNRASNHQQVDVPAKRERPALGDVVLEGVVGTDDGYYAMLRDAKGNPFTLKPGQYFDGGMVVKSVNTKEVIITDGDEERIIPVM